MRTASAFLFVLFAAAAPSGAGAACLPRLPPSQVHELPSAAFESARSVGWLDETHVVIGSRKGVARFDLRKGTWTTILPSADVPHGIPAVENLHTDGKTVVAFGNDRSDIVFDPKSGSIKYAARSVDMLISDLAIHGPTAVVLGTRFLDRETRSTLWIGRYDSPWEDYRPLHRADEKSFAIAHFAMAPHGGAVVIAPDGEIAAISPSEPGVLRYGADGTQLATMGINLTELVVPKLPDVITRYGTDVLGRYEAIINAQPTIDDLVRTPDGLAIVVRRAGGGKVWWELWYPNESTTRKRIRLSIEDSRVAGGHLRCDARGSQLACMFGKMTQLGRPDRPHLVIFDLRRSERDPQCGSQVD